MKKLSFLTLALAICANTYLFAEENQNPQPSQLEALLETNFPEFLVYAAQRAERESKAALNEYSNNEMIVDVLASHQISKDIKSEQAKELYKKAFQSVLNSPYGQFLNKILETGEITENFENSLRDTLIQLHAEFLNCYTVSNCSGHVPQITELQYQNFKTNKISKKNLTWDLLRQKKGAACGADFLIKKYALSFLEEKVDKIRKQKLAELATSQQQHIEETCSGQN